MSRTLCLVLVLAAAPAFAKGKGKSAARGQAPSARAMSELAGKFKWGMSPDEILKQISEDLQEKYAEKLKKEQDVYKQDLLRKEQTEELDKVKSSLTKFDGQKSGWDVSIIDKEFVHRNNESMLVMWEKDQRRFLFFWNDKLYKQYIAFNAEHPVFAGKSFDDFAKLIQNRYGQAEMKFSQLRTKDDQTLDHLEWPPSGDYTLWAIDQSGFYGNFCLKVMQTSVLASLSRAREDKTQKSGRGNALIDSVTSPEAIKGDPNADIVDQILGQQASGKPTSAPQKKKGSSSSSTSDDPLAGSNF
jgi:hypothetical protein